MADRRVHVSWSDRRQRERARGGVRQYSFTHEEREESFILAAVAVAVRKRQVHGVQAYYRERRREAGLMERAIRQQQRWKEGEQSERDGGGVRM